MDLTKFFMDSSHREIDDEVQLSDFFLSLWRKIPSDFHFKFVELACKAMTQIFSFTSSVRSCVISISFEPSLLSALIVLGYDCPWLPVLTLESHHIISTHFHPAQYKQSNLDRHTTPRILLEKYQILL